MNKSDKKPKINTEEMRKLLNTPEMAPVINKNLGWHYHPEHPGMYVLVNGKNLGSGWDCRGRFHFRKFFNTGRLKPVTDKDVINELIYIYNHAVVNFIQTDSIDVI